ncbi:MAG: xanthine dehydrogenase family protein [Thermotogaceae bacterium]|nr:xanthine dehydrogenase family protein [Thermotogaceae bacterium]
MKAIGKTVKRVDGFEKALGYSQYTPDIYIKGMLYAEVVYPDAAHGILKSINIEDAMKVPGVVKIATYKDVPNNRMGIVTKDMQLLVPAGGKVRFEADPIALVAAESPQAAKEAAKKVKFEIEKLKPVLSIDEALKNEVIVNGERNDAFHKKIRRGNIEEAFKNSDLIIEMDFETGYQEQAYLETQGVLAIWDGTYMTIYGSMQCPYYVQNDVAEVLNLPLNRVTVIQMETGGAFGGKEDVPSYVAAKAALLSYLTRRPVKLIYKRDEDMRETSKRHPSKSYYKVGFTKDGKITAVEIKAYLDMGAYSTLSPIVMFRTLTHAAGAYAVDNVKVDVWGVYTNRVPCGAFRGFGSPQVLFAMESVMDEAAKRLGIDPYEIRYKNAIEVGKAISTGQVLKSSVGATKTLEYVKEMSNYEELKKEVEEFNKKNRFKKRGLGWSHTIYGVSLGAAGQHLDGAAANLQVKSDGTATVMIGNTEMGQGAKTTMALIVAEVLGIPIERITVLQPNTSVLQDSGPTVASRTTVYSGNALRLAAEKIRDNIIAFIKENGWAQNVEIDYGVWKLDGKEVPIEEIVQKANNANVKLVEVQWYKTRPLRYDQETGAGEAYVAYTFSTQLSLVEVDLLTGKPQALKVWVSHDIGKVINLDGAIGQVHGGVVQGMGYAIMEEIKHSEDGKMLVTNFNNYVVPTIRDIPDIEVKFVEEEFEGGPFGAKGLGEPSLMSSPPSIANAVSNAVGIRFNKLPVTPEDILLKTC